MKALKKGKAADFFKKQQKKQDPEQILNEVEAKCIAGQVGIAQQQIPQFKWFFDQLTNLKLPSNYEKQINEKKTKISYFDKVSKQSSLVHPLINLIRTFFYTQYKGIRSTFTFEKKKEKLLPHVEQKMMKNCISLNSKRRQVEKLNVQKDQNGNTVLSKCARLQPDIKSLISARSYMLKMLVEKVYTCKQIWGKGKRARTFANIMNQRHKENEDEQELNNQTPQDLQTYQSIFIQASKFYEDQYGKLTKLPLQIKESHQYKISTPENVLRNIALLNIGKNQIQFYWFARLMDCLPIPHSWSKSHISATQMYIYEPLQLQFDIHPSYIYIVKQMNEFKEYFHSLSDSKKAFYYKDRQMIFFDFFERQYTVDMYGLTLKEEIKTQSEIVGTLNRQRDTSANSNDWMVVEGILNSGMNSEQYPLIGEICDFWSSKYFPEQEWMPLVSPFGQITWSSTVNYSSIDYCPYKQILTKKVSSFRQTIPEVKIQDFKTSIQDSISLNKDRIEITEGKHAQIELIKLGNERQRFLEFYVTHINEQTPFEVGEYSVEDYFDQIFVCPFDFEFSFSFNEEEVPFWLEKRNADQLQKKIKCAKKNNQNYDQMFYEVQNYAIEITKRKEPQKLEEIKEKLRNIKNFQSLEKFTNQITDFEARSKRLLRDLPDPKAPEDNIFGSEEEYIDISQAKKSQYSSSQSEKSSEQSESNQQPDNGIQQSLQSSVQHVQQPIQIIKEPSIISQPEEQPHERIDHSFIKEMAATKVYQKSKQLQKLSSKELSDRLKKKQSSKLQKHKYSSNYMKYTSSYHLKKSSVLKKETNPKIQSNKDNVRQEQADNIKKNFILTNMKYSSVPYKNRNLLRFPQNKNAEQYLSDKKVDEIKKKADVKNVSDFHLLDNSKHINRFKSEMENYETHDIIDHLNQLPKKQIVTVPVQQKEVSNPEIVPEPPKEEEPVLILQPIKRVKPDILQDPRLRHINDIDAQSELSTLNSIFNKKSLNSTQASIKLRVRSKSSTLLQPIQMTKKQAQKSPSPLKSTPLKQKQTSRFESLNLRSKSLRKESGMQSMSGEMFSTLSSFNRVCLGHTASSFLVSEPITRKSQLIVIEARKNLLHKGRGLQTYLSKKY